MPDLKLHSSMDEALNIVRSDTVSLCK